MNIPFGPFEPDKSPFEASVSQNVVNALPVANGWGPMPGLSVISQPLPSPCRGAVYVRTSTGTYSIIAGTETGLYRLDTTDYSWIDISGPSAPYSVPLRARSMAGGATARPSMGAAPSMGPPLSMRAAPPMRGRRWPW